MDTEIALEVIMKLLISLFLGGLIGIEREWRKHPAGLRTHILVSVGATAFMFLGYYSFDNGGGSGGFVDPTRIAAGVVTGIGFLGAGAIMKEGVNVRGLTTAASIWVSAAVGLCVGASLFITATVLTLTVLFTLLFFSRMELEIGTKGRSGSLQVAGEAFMGLPKKVGKILKEERISINSVGLNRAGNKVFIRYQLELPPRMDSSDLLNALSREKAVEKVEWIE